MNRCLLSTLIAASLLATTVVCAAQTSLPAAQKHVANGQPGARNFPSHAQAAVLRLQEAPNATLNGQAIRTAPGFRLFSADNKLIFAHTVQNQDLQVVYVKEASTHWLLTAWILSPAERSAWGNQR